MMKKAISFLMVLSLVLVSFAALAEAPATEDDKNFVLTLTGNPTTGYEWECVADDELITVEKEFLTSADLDKLAGVEPAAEPMVGEGGLYIFTVKGVKPGDTLIALEYAQSWDETSTVVGLTYALRVNEDLSVVCVGSMVGV